MKFMYLKFPLQLTILLITILQTAICLKVTSSSSSNNQLLANPVQQSVLPNYMVNWFNTDFQAEDIGVGSEGDVYAIGLNRRLYIYDFLKNIYKPVLGDIEIPSLSRVAVDSDGTPYVVASSGQIYYLDCSNKWVQLPGCASDIGIGRGGEIWKIGCDDRNGGFGIWKLFCKNKPKCGCEKSCVRFRPMHYLANVYPTNGHCFWYRVEGAANRIDVNTEGYPNVVTKDGVVYDYDGVNWLRVNGIIARDITVSNENEVFVTGKDGGVYMLTNAANGSWIKLGGAVADSAIEISAGPLSQPWIIHSSGFIYTSSKGAYN